MHTRQLCALPWNFCRANYLVSLPIDFLFEELRNPPNTPHSVPFKVHFSKLPFHTTLSDHSRKKNKKLGLPSEKRVKAAFAKLMDHFEAFGQSCLSDYIIGEVEFRT